MKKYFNKNIFKDKSFIKMVCFTIVLLLVLVLGNSFGYVSADSGSSSVGWLNSDDYESSANYDPDNQWVNFVDPDSSEVTSSNLEVSYSGILGMDFGSIADVPSSFNYDNMTKYLITGSSYPSNFRVYLWEDPNDTSHCYYNSSSSNISIYLGNSTISHIYYCDIGCYGNGYELQSVTLPASIQELTCNWMSERGVYFYAAPIPTTSPCCLMTNSDLLTLSGTAQLGSYAADLFDYLDGGTNNNIVNVNYLIGSAMKLNGFDNLVGVSDGLDDLDSELPENNMYVDSADWVMNNYSTDLINNWKTISVMFTSNLNDYIRENYDNSELQDFYITYDFVVDTYFYYYALNYDDLGSGDISFAKGLVTIGYNAPLSTTSESKFKFACTYKKSDANSPLSQSVANFIEAGNSHVWSLNTIFPMLTPSGKLEINYDQDQDPSNNNSTSYSQDIEFTLPELMQKINDGQLRLNNNSFTSFKLTCKATICYGNQATNDVVESSGSYTETFDLLTGESTIGDSSMLTNYNPYNSNDAESYDVIPSSGGSSTSSASTGNVTQTVTVTNSGAEYIPSLVSKLLPTSLGDTGTGLVDTFATMVQSNGWIAIMASTVPAIPSEMWNYMTTYLSITLYLLACAFVLRLILDLL